MDRARVSVSVRKNQKGKGKATSGMRKVTERPFCGDHVTCDQEDQSIATDVSNILKVKHCRWRRLLGAGSYAKVHLIERKGEKLAVKVISRSSASYDFLTRFLPRELEILTSVEHENIIRVREVCDTAAHICIFTDYAPNGDLLKFIQDHGALMEPLAFWFFAQLHSAVQYMHGLGICHRDLKCENALLDCDYRLKLCDFGFARRCQDSRGGRLMSETYCGSCAYAAPEVLQGVSYDPMAYDIWSLGCILFIILCGFMPFDDRLPKAVLQKQLNKSILFPKDLLLSDEAESLVLAILEPAPKERYSLSQIADSTWYTAAGFLATYAVLADQIDQLYMLEHPQASRRPFSKNLTMNCTQEFDVNANATNDSQKFDCTASVVSQFS